MARRAKFGRAYRVQPSLTSTLVSIARDMVAREDANIMDAWQHGGEFEGHKVTDAMVLKYWKGREEGLDHDDPTFDTMQDQIQQLQYGIAQSKMDLEHVQGKVSDSQFAQFYLKWAQKAPRNSEWWRSLQKDAAQLMESAKAKGRQSADSAKAEAFNKFQTNEYKHNIGVGNALAEAMDSMSQATGLSTTDHGEQLLGLLTDDYAAHPEKYKALNQALKDGDAHFGGTFDMAYYASAMNKATTGYGRIADRANKDGYADNFASAARQEAALAGHATDVKAWPVAKSYDEAAKRRDRVMNDPHASEMDKQAANEAFAAVAQGLSTTPGIDEVAKVALQNDAARAMGEDISADGESFGPTFLGRSHAGITVEDGQQQALYTARKDLMTQNPELFAYAPLDKNGNFDPTGKGAVGIVERSAVPTDAVFVPAPGLNGTPHMVAVQPHTVYMADPNNPPKDGADAAGTQVGRTATLYIGGTSVTFYATGAGDGQERWSTSSPFASGLTSTPDKSGNVQLSVPVTQSDAERATNIYNQAKTIDAAHGTSMADSLVARDGAGNITGLSDVAAGTQFYAKSGSAESGANGGVTVAFDPSKGFTVTSSQSQKEGGLGGALSTQTGGKIVENVPFAVTGQTFDPAQTYKLAIDPARYTAGAIPGVTYDTIASAAASTFSTMLNGNQLRTIINDPEFQHSFIVQANSAIGVVDPINDLRGQQAWDSFKGTVSAAADKSFYDLFKRDMAVVNGLFGATARTDLTYPGKTGGDGRSDVPGISFGGQNIKVPAIPSMLNASGGPDRTKPLGSPTFAAQTLQPGQVPGQPAGAYTPPTSFTTTPTGAKTKAPSTTPGTTPTSPSPLPGTTPGADPGHHTGLGGA